MYITFPCKSSSEASYLFEGKKKSEKEKTWSKNSIVFESYEKHQTHVRIARLFLLSFFFLNFLIRENGYVNFKLQI